MKEETKLKISNSTKGRVPWNKGKKESIKHVYYTNGVKNIRLPIDVVPPQGFVRGAKHSSLSDESRIKFNEQHAKTCIERYGDPNYNNMSKNKATKLLRYGDSNYNNRDKASQTCLEKYGVDNVSKLPGVRNVISIKLKNHKMSQDAKLKIAMKATGRLQPLSTISKRFETMKSRNTLNSSIAESIYFVYLKQLYSEDDIIRQYKDDRYPFACDFYIKSEDRYIELNLHWTHGGRPYDPNDEECQEQLAIWQEKAKTSQFYKNAIETWTVRDVVKRNCAKENNLNYIIIYKI